MPGLAYSKFFEASVAWSENDVKASNAICFIAMITVKTGTGIFSSSSKKSVASVNLNAYKNWLYVYIDSIKRRPQSHGSTQ